MGIRLQLNKLVSTGKVRGKAISSASIMGSPETYTARVKKYGQRSLQTDRISICFGVSSLEKKERNNKFTKLL